MRVHTFEGSNNIRSAAFDAKSGVCVVTFNNGKSYSFRSFTEQTFDEWAKAPSAGSWFHRNVRMRPDRYPRVETSAAGDLKASDIGLTTENSTDRSVEDCKAKFDSVDTFGGLPPRPEENAFLRIEREVAPVAPPGSWRDVKTKVARDPTMERLIYYDHDQHEWKDQQGNVWRPLERLS